MAKIYDKIQKLLNMANGSVQGNEAEVALAMAHDLMAQNGITMADLDAAGRDEELGKLGEWKYGDKAYKIWEKHLAGAIGKLFDCEVIYGSTPGTTKKSMNFVGREGNARSAFAMYDWIHDKLWKDAKAKIVPYSLSGCNSYCVGAVSSICNRVNEMKRKDISEGNSWGLVVIDEVRDYMHKLYPHLVKKSTSSTVRDRFAYGVGRADGNNIGLNKQVGLRCISA